MSPIRLLRGISNGFLASGCIGLHRLTGGAPGDWLSRCALLAILRMYQSGGGIDEGAWVLFTGWGETGRETLRLMLARHQIPRGRQWTANLLNSAPDGEES